MRDAGESGKAPPGDRLADFRQDVSSAHDSAHPEERTDSGTRGACRTGVVRLTVTFRMTSSHEVRELIETLRFLIATTRHEAGCDMCSAWSDPDFTVHYSEQWASEADLRRRVCSAGFTSLLGAMEYASEPPCVQFDVATGARGLDFVAEARASSGGGPPGEYWPDCVN